ncbi:flagellar hook assembly protein FlgD [Xylophilus ampelinus]|uniref:Basal-body rod modification protein FlgD n=1 Tax=Xylophilus ampelinus TaxID=54067 RepID=A0A318SR15_9BURK|nr:flagellar hook capping FlgD N-terminal domain-containing protein [Xylophilus ampelinus]MCS4511227.1 flagellar hook assembly protein FlgD [Xylophilus ampelinus]PYE75020.1 flagellar basal-body rod modification protein FlgD [Xylophilus ampelinus]
MATTNNVAAATSSSTYTYTPTTDASKAATGAAANVANDPATAQDRFLKLLVAQLTNQDPTNPMDNAQMTSQIAQINTVTGITQLNSTVKDMAAQLAATQGLQATALVGRTVQAEGDTLSIDKTGKTGTGGFELSGAASSVVVNIATASGKSLGSINMGTQSAGAHDFSFDTSGYTGTEPLKFTVEATNKGTAVSSTSLTRSTVTSVGSDSSGALTLNLGNGSSVAYGKVKAIS